MPALLKKIPHIQLFRYTPISALSACLLLPIPYAAVKAHPFSNMAIAISIGNAPNDVKACFAAAVAPGSGQSKGSPSAPRRPITPLSSVGSARAGRSRPATTAKQVSRNAMLEVLGGGKEEGVRDLIYRVWKWEMAEGSRSTSSARGSKGMTLCDGETEHLLGYLEVL